MKKDLVLLVSKAEVLKELMGKSHEFVHANIFFSVVWHLQQVQNDSVHADVAKKALLMLAGFCWMSCYTQFVHANQNLQ